MRNNIAKHIFDMCFGQKQHATPRVTTRYPQGNTPLLAGKRIVTPALVFLMLSFNFVKVWGQTEITSLSSIGSTGDYIITDDIDASGFTTIASFSGTLTARAKADGTFPVITNLSAPLFTTATGATISNIILNKVKISQSGKTGSIACVADGATRIYNCGILSGEVKSTGTSSEKSSKDCCGGLVGELLGTARVINCYSYATITGGNRVGGIVGYNNGTTTAGSINTMVMNCMFYGDITAGNMVSPIYGGNNISNIRHDSDRKKDGLNTFNYYAYDKATSFKGFDNDKKLLYNCALAVEEKYLNRFEFYRLLLNSNKKLAAIYASKEGATVNPNDMAKWVLETADRNISEHNPYPYPILKAQGKYPSIINYDVEHAPDSASVGRNKGGKLGTKTLSVTIKAPSDWTNAPSGAKLLDASGNEIATSRTITLTRTDKDEDRFNFNYDKVQLPYYNDYGTKNYTSYKAVTGWKITKITGGTTGTYTAADQWNGYNFADRNCTNKDLYGTNGSNRVFSQGAYYDVPYGVTKIEIEPYWGNAAYIADANYDVVYKKDFSSKQNVTQTGTQVGDNTNFNSQSVKSTVANALSVISSNGGLGSTVYDNAIVLIGNLHLDGVPSNGTTPFTMMSVDEDNDHEPDYSLIYHHKARLNVSPIRFDFLNVPGTSQAQRPNGASLACNVSIFKTKGWFEITNTALLYFSQFEYENLGNSDNNDNKDKVDDPLILQGGVFDQFVSTQSSAVNGKVIYIHVGGNVWFHEFGLGTHSDGEQSTPHVPVSVTGGDYDGFYLTGTYNQDAAERTDNAECYISGGHFQEAAGASQEPINGDVRWQIYDADIENFFGGGVNAARPIKGDVTVDIYNSHVTTYCGGPKFGNMQSGKQVKTTAEGCVFTNYFGAGYGGNSYSRKKYYDKEKYDFDSWDNDYVTDRGKFFDGKTTNAVSAQYGKKGLGVATDFDYEFFIWSKGNTGGRFFVKFVSFSLAQCNDVESFLKKCKINENFYGGGNLGKVSGTATSTLEDCEVTGNVFGAGYSATLPKIKVRSGGFTTLPKFNSNSGMFEPGEPAMPTSTDMTGTEEYEWIHKDKYPNNNTGGFLDKDGNYDTNGKYVVTTVDISSNNLGSVGSVNLTIKGTTTVAGSVYGGGALACMDANGVAKINLLGGTINGDVYGGGQGRLEAGTSGQEGYVSPVAAMVGSTKVNLNGMETGDYVAADHSSLVQAVMNGEDVAYYTLKTKDANNKPIKGCVVKGDIFGCNNLNGTPKGDVTVNIYKTEGYTGHMRTGYNAETAAAREAALDDIDDSHHSYEVKAVYGGGNLAAYEPDSPDTKHTQVNIYGCGDTSIRQVYGGGNAASTPATQVDVYGTYEIEEVFGGGNGKDDISHDGGTTKIKNPGANVGFKDYWDYENEKDLEAYDTKEERQEDDFISNYVYGTGEAHVNIHGGRTHRVYGGSNTKGNVKAVAVTMLEDVTGCDFKVDEAYGGGKSAEMDGASRLEMACIPGLKNAYGGAEAANIESDVTLTITNGNFDRVFGGNNVSGTISGTITVNIEETGCHLITIGQLYGGGNQAAYTGPLKSGSTTERQGPTVNVKSFSSIGDIYGGGYGKTATVTGDTYVNINVCDGKNFDDGQDAEVTKANQHTGDQTISFSEFRRTDNGGFETDDDGNRIVDNQEVPVYLPPFTSGEIGGINNVYGGGNAAKVVGNTNVNIGTLSEVEMVSDNQTKTVKGANIVGNVYGGGNKAEVTGNTNVTIGKTTAQ